MSTNLQRYMVVVDNKLKKTRKKLQTEIPVISFSDESVAKRWVTAFVDHGEPFRGNWRVVEFAPLLNREPVYGTIIGFEWELFVGEIRPFNFMIIVEDRGVTIINFNRDLTRDINRVLRDLGRFDDAYKTAREGHRYPREGDYDAT